MLSAREAAREYGLADQLGRPLHHRLFETFGDPTPNPAQKAKSQPTERDMQALSAAMVLRQMGWSYRAPFDQWSRSKSNQVALIRMLLNPKSGKPKILVSAELAAESKRLTRMSYTSKGIWAGLNEGVRYKKNALGNVEEVIDKSKGWDHIHDCLCYKCVMVFPGEVRRLFDPEQGLLTGATAWARGEPS